MILTTRYLTTPYLTAPYLTAPYLTAPYLTARYLIARYRATSEPTRRPAGSAPTRLVTRYSTLVTRTVQE